jgi:hypothetical protein
MEGVVDTPGHREVERSIAAAGVVAVAEGGAGYDLEVLLYMSAVVHGIRLVLVNSRG